MGKPATQCTFVFHPYMDSNGNDIGRYSGGVTNYKKICLANPKCTCFNTNGWVKYITKPKNQWRKWTNNKRLGLYVKTCTKPTPVPPIKPAPTTPSKPVNPPSGASKPGYSCEGANQKKNLGTGFKTPQQCLAAAVADSGCGSSIMWSDSYNYSWGCRCCVPGATYTKHNLWDIYQVESPPKTYVTNWWHCFDRQGWCQASAGYMTGLYRSDNLGGLKDDISRLEEVSSADAPSYLSGGMSCYNQNIQDSFDRKGWSKCNPGYYMKGLYRTNGLFRAGLHNIETAKCCKPTNQRSAWGSCYQANVLHSFDRKGWSKCSPGYYMAGMWRNDCDNLYCIEYFHCCEMGAYAEEDSIFEE